MSFDGLFSNPPILMKKFISTPEISRAYTYDILLVPTRVKKSMSILFGIWYPNLEFPNSANISLIDYL